MNDRHDHHDTEGTDAQRAAREAVRSLAAPEASEEFRADLRRRFVQDEFPSAVEGPRPVALVAPRRRWRRFAIPVAMAAALILAIGLGNQRGGWEVVGADGSDVVLVDGVEMSCAELDPLQAALHPGCHLEVPVGGQLEVVSDVLALQINGGTSMTLPAVPGRWFGREVRSQVDGAGTLRIATGPEFRGSRYVIDTGATRLEVVGTAFSVMSGPDVVCVCVLEGDVIATMSDGTERRIPSGGRLTVQREGGAFDTGSMHDTERAALSALRARLEG